MHVHSCMHTHVHSCVHTCTEECTHMQCMYACTHVHVYIHAPPVMRRKQLSVEGAGVSTQARPAVTQAGY